MTINLTAKRKNTLDTSVSIEFSGIKNENFQYVASQQIKNANGEVGVIFHIKGTDFAVIDSTGNDIVKFNAHFEIEKETIIRVFYWNDSDLVSANVACFENFLKEYGLDENAPICDFDCLQTTKSLAIPRQAGNGGVVMIVDIP